MKKRQLAAIVFFGILPSVTAANATDAPATQKHKVKIHFEGLVTHVPEGQAGQEGKLTVLMGDSSSPWALPVKGAMLGGKFEPLAAHQARLYFRAAQGFGSSSWTVKKATFQHPSCKPPPSATHFIDLDRDDITIVNAAAPKFKVPARNSAPKPNGVAKADYGWVPSLKKLANQSVNPAFGGRPCSQCDLLEARLTTEYGTLESELRSSAR